MAFKVKLWGCRGSLPTPKTPQEIEDRVLGLLEEFQGSELSPQKFLATKKREVVGGFGGHTACVEVFSDSTSLIVDGGSGIRPLGAKLMAGPCGLGKAEVHILMTHFHWDHLVGLPFFVPLFVPGNKIHFYAVQENLVEVIRTVFSKPYFPVSFESLASEIVFHKLEPRRPVDFDGLSVTPYELDHPDPCWGYRFEKQGKSFAYCVDTEATRMSRQEMGEDVKLYENADLMVFDAQYTFKEVTERVHWGHSSGPVGVDIAMREKVKKAYFVHHDPAASDEGILQAEGQTRDYYDTKVAAEKKLGREVHNLEWAFAREGDIFEV